MAFRQHLTRSGLLKASDFMKLTEAKPRLALLDASWFLPNNPRNAHDEFLKQKRLSNDTRFADIDAIKDDASPYPHMLPSVDVFNASMGKLGVTLEDDGVVVYDTAGNFSAPRMAWMLEIFGHPSTALLDNFVDYESKGFPVESSDISGSAEPKEAPQPFQSKGLDKSRVISFEELKAIVEDPAKAAAEYVILDARPNGRFTGADPEPRPGLPSGHVPSAISLPFNKVLDSAQNNIFLPAEKLKELFAATIKEPVGDKQIIAMCGTGVTACVLERAVRIAELSDKPVKVYDGSWT